MSSRHPCSDPVQALSGVLSNLFVTVVLLGAVSAALANVINNQVHPPCACSAGSKLAPFPLPSVPHSCHHRISSADHAICTAFICSTGPRLVFQLHGVLCRQQML